MTIGTPQPTKAPFPYFGGKSKIAPTVWQQIGPVKNVVIPFVGSAAEVLAYPYDNSPIVTLNDKDGFVANFWRAVDRDPAAVACYLDWPVNEIDLFARHVWLLKQLETLRTRLECDPEWCDPKIAGWWCWGACGWIGSDWCSGNGPWWAEGDQVINIRGDAGQGVHRQLPHLGNAGRGVHRQLPHLGNAGRGVHRQHLEDYMFALRDALRGARVACGDWRRVVTSSVTTRHGVTAILLDPPYGEGAQDYAAGGNGDPTLACDVWQWAVANGDNPLLKIAVYGYEDGREVPDGWQALPWKARKGYQTSTANSHREVVWFSPHCLEAV